MGFSPITAGSTTTAHTHTNASGDGGSLDSNSLILNTPLIGLIG